MSFLDSSFAFKKEEGKAGETTHAQLSITSRAHFDSAPVALSRLEIEFTGGMKTILLQHRDTEDDRHKPNRVTVSSVALEEKIKTEEGLAEGISDDQYFHGVGSLTLRPGHTVAFNMEIPLREPGEASVASVSYTHLTLPTKA